MNIEEIYREIEGYFQQLETLDDGEHLIDRYKRVVAIMVRVGHLRSQIAWLEVNGQASPQQKKFRTMVLDPFIERLQEIARYESRAITAKTVEFNMEK